MRVAVYGVSGFAVRADATGAIALVDFQKWQIALVNFESAQVKYKEITQNSKNVLLKPFKVLVSRIFLKYRKIADLFLQ